MTNPLFLYSAGSAIIAIIAMIILLKTFPGFFGLNPARSSQATEAEPRMPVAYLSGIVTQNPDQSGEIVAAIMAAISAVRGPSAGAFRIASMSPSQGSDGFNTPAWGHIDRLVR